jgi:type IV pilus assembly protein PilQ
MNRLWLALGAGIRNGLGAALVAAFATIAALPGLAAAQPAEGLKLQAIDVQTLPGQQLQLRLRLNGPAPEPLSFTIDRPARIALDLPNTGLALQNRRIDVKSGGVDTILAAEAGGRTRLVLNLDTLMPYQTRVEGNSIVVMVGGTQQAAAAAAPAASGGGAAPSRSAAASGPRSIRNIDFRRAPDGAGRVIVDLSDPHTPVNLRQQGTQIVVDFAGASLPAELMKRFDVTDFATPVQNVDALKVSDSSRLVISATGDFEQLAYQTDNQYTIEIKPAVRSTASAQEKKDYTGERLTLNFQDIETRAVLQLLADTSGQNIVVSDSVQGNVTLRLQNVPWDQALDIVLRTKGLDKRREGNVIIVAPTEELAAREKAELAARKDLQELAPLRTEYVQVNYAKAGDLAGLIKSSGGNNSLLSARGNVSIDERTNTLLVQDTADRLQDIRRLVSTLDIPIRQVLIEARIVVANDDFSRNLGVRFGATAIGDQQSLGFGGTNSAGVVSSSGVGREDDDIVLQPNNNNAPGGTPPAISLPNVNDRYMVNLPVANPADRTYAARLGLHSGSGAVGGTGRRTRPDRVRAARSDGEPARSGDRAGYGDSVPGSFLERCDHDSVQEGSARIEGHPADHAGQPHHHGSHRQQGQRGPGDCHLVRRQRALHRYARNRHTGPGQRWSDGGARRHHGDGIPRDRKQGALAG